MYLILCASLAEIKKFAFRLGAQIVVQSSASFSLSQSYRASVYNFPDLFRLEITRRENTNLHRPGRRLFLQAQRIACSGGRDFLCGARRRENFDALRLFAALG